MFVGHPLLSSIRAALHKPACDQMLESILCSNYGLGRKHWKFFGTMEKGLNEAKKICVFFFRSSCCVAVQASHFQPFVPPEFGLGGNSLSFSFEFSIGSRFIRNIFLPQQLLRLWQIGFFIHFESPLNLRTPCPYFAWTVALLGDSFPCPNLQIRTWKAAPFFAFRGWMQILTLPN